jgi:hypothetical protein
MVNVRVEPLLVWIDMLELLTELTVPMARNPRWKPLPYPEDPPVVLFPV